jgi:hypothetical protein
MTDASGDHISATVTGGVSGQFATGKNITQTHTVTGADHLDADERAQLVQLFAALKERIAAEAPDEERSPAIDRLDELEEALTAEEPDLDRVQYVKRWFVRRLPNLAGLITSVLVHPLIGKVVESAGDAALSELTRVADD